MGFMRDVRGIYGNSRGFMLDSWAVEPPKNLMISLQKAVVFLPAKIGCSTMFNQERLDVQGISAVN